MDYVGFIAAPGLDEERWTRMIEEHASLKRPAAAKRINPFTGQLADFHPHPSAARVTVDGIEVGSMQWALDDSPAVVVFGDAALVTPVARDIAALLGGTFTPTE